MPHIPIEKFSTFFGNTSKDAEKHLFRFKSTCDVFHLTKDNVTCQLFAQTFRGNAIKWFCSLMLGTITSWDVLETSFAEKFIPNVFIFLPTHPLPYGHKTMK
jgi:hypothetical protein